MDKFVIWLTGNNPELFRTVATWLLIGAILLAIILIFVVVGKGKNK